MIRDLNYSIQFAEGNEYVLTHEMRLIEGDAKGLHESFAIEGTGVHGARFTRAQLALLHRAIHEMKRMRQQHRDALTDGAEQQPADPEPLLETVCGDPFMGKRPMAGRPLPPRPATDDVLGYVISDKGRAVLAAQESDDD